MIPEHFYITGLGLAVYVALYLPLSFAIAKGANAVLKRRMQSSRQRLATVFLFGLFVASLPMLEVYSISMDAQQLCREQAGLKVYRVVEADGLGNWHFGRRELEHGYTYAENEGTQNRKFRQTIEDGKVVTAPIAEYRSRYWFRGGDNHRVIGRHVGRSSDQVVDRQTNEVLGELVVLFIYPSWFDNLAIAATGTGSGFSAWRCGEEPPAGRTTELGLYDLIFATVHPTKQDKGDRK